MTITIAAGWWMLPTAITIFAFGWCMWWSLSQPPAYGYGAIGAGLGEALVILLTVCIVAIVWITYLSIKLWMV